MGAAEQQDQCLLDSPLLKRATCLARYPHAAQAVLPPACRAQGLLRARACGGDPAARPLPPAPPHLCSHQDVVRPFFACVLCLVPPLPLLLPPPHMLPPAWWCCCGRWDGKVVLLLPTR